MFEALKRPLGFGPSVDYAQLVKEGAIILDVRARREYATGHIKGSLNIASPKASPRANTGLPTCW